MQRRYRPGVTCGTHRGASGHAGQQGLQLNPDPLCRGANLAGISRARASLRIFGDDLDPDEVSKALGASPTEAHRNGDEIVGKATTRIARTGSWHRVTSLPPEAELDDHIQSVLSGLTSDLAVWADLLSRFDADIFCGVFLDHANEGFELSPTVTSALGARGLPVGFDIYGHFEDGEPSAA